MKKSIHYIQPILLALLFVFPSCEEVIMHPNPGQDNMSIFNEYADLCIDKYGLAKAKNVDLVSLADSIRPYITPQLTSEELFNFLGIITTRMKEGHTIIEDKTNNLFKTYEWFIGYPKASNFLVTDKYYYGEEAVADLQTITSNDSFWQIEYGFLPQDNEIGFIRLLNFSLTATDQQLETMMEYLKDTKGLIIDIRSNLGGYIELASRLASNFTSTEVKFADNYIKNGPGPDDFAPTELILAPSGSPYTYTKPVMLLHDRITFSSGSLFTIMMSSLDNVTTVGQTFGGGTGEIIDGYLSNGWYYRLSSSNLVDNQGRPTDNGFDADIPVLIDPGDTLHDAIIDRAILELQ